MQRPRPKKLSSLVPGLVKKSMPSILVQHQDKTYDDPPPCRVCGSEARTRHDKRRRLYATVIGEEGFQDIWVWVKRYRCRECGQIYASRSPFYPGCLYGNLVTEICLYLAAQNPFCRVEAVLQDWGLQIDRDTVRSYARRFGARARDIAGIRIDRSSVAINLVRVLFDAKDTEELRTRLPGEVFQDVADETYPAVKGAKKKLRDENTDRALLGKPPRKYAESHTLASCYEARHRFFVSLLVTHTAFNTMLADALTTPAKGCVGSVRDGSTCYRGEHIHCVNHKARRQIARDPGYRHLKKQAQSRDQIKDYCLRYYGSVRQEEARKAAEAYPELVQNGVFTGALSTNSMEGGNWRIKYGLRVPYKDPASVEARTLLIAVSDSVKTFKAGRPHTSFAQTYGSFEYSTIMSHTTHKNNNPHEPRSRDHTTHPPTPRNTHTDIFTLWLLHSVQRAQKKHKEK